MVVFVHSNACISTWDPKPSILEHSTGILGFQLIRRIRSIFCASCFKDEGQSSLSMSCISQMDCKYFYCGMRQAFGSKSSEITLLLTRLSLLQRSRRQTNMTLVHASTPVHGIMRASPRHVPSQSQFEVNRQCTASSEPSSNTCPIAYLLIATA